MHTLTSTFLWATGISAMLFWLAYTFIMLLLKSNRKDYRRKVAVYTGIVSAVVWLVMLSTAYWKV